MGEAPGNVLEGGGEKRRKHKAFYGAETTEETASSRTVFLIKPEKREAWGERAKGWEGEERFRKKEERRPTK